MNIFATTPDPHTSAAALCDRRVNKMILESAQLLSAAIHAEPRFSKLAPHVYHMPAGSHWQKHPCTIWTKAHPHNAHWLLAHLQGLINEYQYRYERHHPTEQLLPYFYEVDERLTQGHTAQPAEFANCTSSAIAKYDFRTQPVHTAYRLALMTKWLRLDPSKGLTPRWGRRGPPEWLADHNTRTLWARLESAALHPPGTPPVS